MSIFTPEQDAEKFAAYMKQQFVEAGAALIALAGKEVDGFTVTFTMTVSRKPDA